MITAVCAPAISRAERRVTLDVTHPEDVPPPIPFAPLVPRERLAGSSFVIVRMLGQGGMGEIHEVEHMELGRRFALKTLHAKYADRPDLVTRLRDEARLAARIRHANLVEVVDLGVTADGRPWFVMPMLHGRDLRDELVRRGALPPRMAIELMVQALGGLGAAHAAGVVHRDVKLENLFLQDDGTLKVLDFGIAKIARDGALGLTDPDTPPGTPRSMAPEQHEGLDVDARADLYAVGLALYELVTGRGPFDDLKGHDHALRYAHCTREPIAPSRLAPSPLPRGFDDVILRALAKSPVDRFQHATEMAAALRALLIEAPRPPRAARARRIARPRVKERDLRVAVVSSALAVAIFALGLAFGRALPARGPSDPAPSTPAATKL